MLSRTPARLIDLCESMKLSMSDCLLIWSDLEKAQYAKLTTSNSEGNMVVAVLLRFGRTDNRAPGQ